MLSRFFFHLLRDLRGGSEIEYCVIDWRSLSSRLGSLARRSLGLLDSRSINASTGRRLLVPDIPVRPRSLYHLILLPLISAWLQLMIGCHDLLLMLSFFIAKGCLPNIPTVLHRSFSLCGFLHHLKMHLVMWRVLLLRHFCILFAHIFL